MKVTNNTDRAIAIGAVTLAGGASIDLEETQVSPAMRLIEKGGAVSIGEAEAAGKSKGKGA
ncbi:hypothetical protein [Profundibacterium mesophilum]|uniref:Uncharacterized protein n=1 Tax=Profundibacterium mesophilum KAUST100406-0324 TaxID=1037889 RepID=A0A921NT86_9RHOB|nr:hypothetical protein [Profundibacterium mesophilum]KAF0675078.1 hypothetical protein PMES_02599 [Profundibacterium mesophilum KAUST100406-0324]